MQGFFSTSKVQTERPGATLVPRCGACGLFKRCHSPKMPVYGDGAKRVLVVGETPGAEDDEHGRLFMGEGGRLLRTTLRQQGFDLDRDAWVTSALICRLGHGKAPDDAQVGYCRPNLLNTIRTYEPRVIVTLGRAALVSVIKGAWNDIGPLERWTGWKIPLEGHYVCPTFHPMVLLRDKNGLMERLFAKHLHRAFNIQHAPPPQMDFDRHIEVLYDEDVVYDAIRDITRQGGWAAVDYEANCLKPEYPGSQIYSCAISNGDRTISYLWTPRAAEATGKFLRAEQVKKIAANLKFEERWTLEKFGHGVANWGWDTMLAAHCLDNRQSITSLKFQSFVKMGVPVYNEHIEPYLRSRDNSPLNRIHEIEVRDLLYYGGMDAVLEYRLAMIQRKEMGYAREA